jgi:hypothetical protein
VTSPGLRLGVETPTVNLARTPSLKSAERARRYWVMTVGTNRSAGGAVFGASHQFMLHAP